VTRHERSRCKGTRADSAPARGDVGAADAGLARALLLRLALADVVCELPERRAVVGAGREPGLGVAVRGREDGRAAAAALREVELPEDVRAGGDGREDLVLVQGVPEHVLGAQLGAARGLCGRGRLTIQRSRPTYAFAANHGNLAAIAPHSAGSGAARGAHPTSAASASAIIGYVSSGHASGAVGASDASVTRAVLLVNAQASRSAPVAGGGDVLRRGSGE
jgi:hypothetical protein